MTRPQQASATGTLSPRTVGLGLGAVSIIAGGLVSALTSPLDLTKGSWAAAYLVLVMGVAQIVLAEQSRLLHGADDTSRSALAGLVTWSLGNALVLVGSLASLPIVVDLGGILLVFVVVGALWATRGSQVGLLAWGFRFVQAVVLVSIPVGLVLAHLRA